LFKYCGGVTPFKSNCDGVGNPVKVGAPLSEY
jgi:hypothetical protein